MKTLLLKLHCKLVATIIARLSASCGGELTLADVGKAALNGVGFVLVLGLIGMGVTVCMVLRIGTL